MAEYCDVMVAHSPPLFTAHNSPPELSVLYQNFRLVMTQKQQSPLSVRRFGNASARSSGSPTRENRQGGSAKPRRPCLVIRADSDGSIGSSSSSGGSSSDENEPASPTRRKKKVVFADDRGLSLTQVRLMNEPSNQPPKLMNFGPYQQQSVASALTGAGVLASNKSQDKQKHWQLRFSQPASCYLDFRKRLDTRNVSLENVIVKSPESRAVGTVKVRNLSYDKEVFVRSTNDKWATHRDTLCSYVQNSGSSCGGGLAGGGGSGPMQNGVTAIYDTFSFSLQLPTDASFMEFAVCYKSLEFECWDSNDGNNYCLSLSCGQSATGQQPQQQSGGGGMTVADFDHHRQKQPVHYFGAQSRQNSWTTWRDQKNDTTAYW